MTFSSAESFTRTQQRLMGKEASVGLLHQLAAVSADDGITWAIYGVRRRAQRSSYHCLARPEGEPAGLDPGMTVWIEN
jgi:hypothetical protein